MEGQYLNPLKFCPGFRHMTEQIFLQLDQKSLANCRNVSKSWLRCVDNKKYSWIQIVKIPKILQNGDTYIHLSAKKGQKEVFEKLLDEEEEKNSKNQDEDTTFHLVCKHGHLKIANMLISKSAELKIDLNAKGKLGMTAFNYACQEGQLKIVEMLVQKSADYLIEIDVKNNYGYTAVHTAGLYGHSEIVKILIKTLSKYNFDINAKTDNGFAAFHLACYNGNKASVKIMLESRQLNLLATDKFECTGLEIAEKKRNTEVAKLTKEKLD